MLFRQILNLLRGKRPPELQQAVDAHRRAVERSVRGDHLMSHVVRDARLNVRSAIESVDRSWER